MRLASLLPLAAVLVALAGCGGDDQSSTTTGPPAGGPLVSYAKSGGVAGVDERLVVEPDGAATLVVRYGDQMQRRFELAGDQLERLRDELDAADFGGIDTQPGLGCADCFEFEIVSGERRAQFNELAELPDSVRALLTELGGIVEDHLPATAQAG